MQRKFKKGYFVQGKFVAEGSELDLELKRELKGTDEQSRTDLKRESTLLQELGESLLTLRADLLTGLGLSEKFEDAITEAKRITNFEGKRRQMQFIGKLMRQLEPDQHDAIRAALVEQHSGSAQETLTLHLSETWRDRLVADDSAFEQWLLQAPRSDTQQLRALIRQARKDAAPEKPGAAPRHGRAFREIFQLVRAHLSDPPTDTDETPDASSRFPAGHGQGLG